MALTNNTVTVDTTAGGVKIFDPAGGQRFGVKISNTHATLTLYVGASGLTTATGSPILAGMSDYYDDIQDAIWGIAPSSSINVRFLAWGKAIR